MEMWAALPMPICSLTCQNTLRLWGPLWTHSAFGFESKNGCLKHLYHSRADIVDQLVLNIDIQQTLQLLHPELQQKESTETLNFLMTMNGNAPRRGMKLIDNHTYSVGRVTQKHLTVAEYTAIGMASTPSQVPVFSRCFHNGTLYHSASYLKGQGKRNDQVCHFTADERCEIQLFVLTPLPVAIVKVFEHSDSTFLQQAGEPCRRILNEYKEIDFLDAFLHEVVVHDHLKLKAVPVQSITGKAVHLENSECWSSQTPLNITRDLFSYIMCMCTYMYQHGLICGLLCKQVRLFTSCWVITFIRQDVWSLLHHFLVVILSEINLYSSMALPKIAMVQTRWLVLCDTIWTSNLEKILSRFMQGSYKNWTIMYAKRLIHDKNLARFPCQISHE